MKIISAAAGARHTVMISNDGMVFVAGRLWPSYKPERDIHSSMSHSGKNALKNSLEDSVGQTVGHSEGRIITGGGITGTEGTGGVTGEKGGGSGVKRAVKSSVGRKGDRRPPGPVQRHSTRSIHRINRTITFGLGGGTRDARNHIRSASASTASASSTSTSSSTGMTSSITSSSSATASAAASAGVSSTVSFKVSKNTAAEAAKLLGAASVSLVPRKVLYFTLLTLLCLSYHAR